MEEFEQLQRTKLVAVMINPSTKVGLSDVFTELVSLMQATYLHYDDVRSLLSMSLPRADDGKLVQTACRVLRRAAATQLSFGRSAFVVSPLPLELNGCRAHLNGLLEVADSYGVPLTVIQLEGEPQVRNSEFQVTLNSIPHLIFSLQGLGIFREDYGEGSDDLVGKHKELTVVPLFVVCAFWGVIESFDDEIELNHAGTSGSLQFRHFGHRHPLLLNPGVDVNTPAIDLSCSVCTATILGLDSYYGCVSCGFFLHKTCSELPQNMVSPIHSHALHLVILSKEKKGSHLFNYSRKNPHRLIMCLICNGYAQEGPRPLYGCLHCPDLFLHYECIGSGKHIIEHHLHPHPLQLQTLEFPILGPYFVCHACGCFGNKIWYTCKECQFCYHKQCLQILPPSVLHKRHKEHALTLCIPPKDETNEYYCEVCAERRHPDFWIYYCKTCEYEAHPHCVIQGIPAYAYEEGGINKILEDGAPDPANFNSQMRKVLRELREKNKDISKRWYDYI